MEPNPYETPASYSASGRPRSWLVWLAVAALSVPLIVALGIGLILLAGFLLIAIDGLEGIQ
jgi:hypothetical protein